LSFQSFAHTVFNIGTATKTNSKLAALANYFEKAPDADKVWTIAIFSGRRPKRLVKSSLLHQWCAELANIPIWLFEESYHTVGDLAETIALCIPQQQKQSEGFADHTLSDLIDRFLVLQNATEEEKKLFITTSWKQLSFEACFVFNKLITGGFRVGISQQMMVNTLQKVAGLEAAAIAHRISGQWDPAAMRFHSLLFENDTSHDASKPYPFYLAYQLDDEITALGRPHEWQAEWKWDGIRGQIIKRHDLLFVWSRGEELMTERFPELQSLLSHLPNGVCLDGEIVCIDPDANEEWKPLPFSLLQTRIGRKTVSKKQLQQAPVGFIAYDLLEWDAKDIRNDALADRRFLLEQMVNDINHPLLKLSPVITHNDWDHLADLRKGSREMASEGIMLKRKTSVYQVGRKVGDWWKWKIDPLTIDAVMIYAQKGHGRRSNLYTDYTFAVRDGDRLVTFTKAYSGLTDKEFAEVDAFVKKNSLEKFGPVRTVKPELVFEIAFEGIAASNRHKSGVALRFPRISRWRRDKKPDEINTLEDLKLLLTRYGRQL
jgi:DNA ligase-1